MTISAKQVEERRKWIGASDMPAILGVDKYRNSADVWAVKTDRLPDQRDNDDTRLGNFLEPFVLSEAENVLGSIIRPRKTRLIPNLPLAANLDALTRAGHMPVEAKTHAILSGRADEQWGEEGTDEVPERVIIQVHVQMMATESELAHIAALISGHGRAVTMYRVQRSEELCSMIAQEAVRFWECVESDMPPAAVVPHLTTLKRMRREPGKIVEVSPEIVGAWLHAKETSSAAEKAKEQAERELLAALGDAEAAEWGTGERITYMQQERSGYTVAPTTFRVLRHKKG